MGGGLAFLNKKGWHPGSIRNQEKVWAREQERDTENRRLDELKEQIEQERAQEEMRGLAKKAGIKQNNNSMDWMYQGGMRARQEADQRGGQGQAANSTAAEPTGVQVQQEMPPVQLPAFLTEDTPASANEVWVRLHNDPLFAIKQQEIAARKTVLANPVQMDAIKKNADQVGLTAQQQKAERKHAKKVAKAAKKAKKQALKAQADSSEDSEADQPPAKVRRVERPAEASNGHAQPSREREHHREERGVPRREQTGDRHRDERDGHRRYDHGGDREHDRSRHDDRRREQGQQPRGRYEDSERHSHRDRHRDGAAPEQRSSEAARANGEASRQQQNGPAERSKREGKGEYGLRMSGAAPQGMADVDRSAAVTATRAALEKAAAAKEEAEKLKASQRYVKKEFKTGKLSEEERTQRLAEMTGNANVHEEARWQRLANARKKDQHEDGPAPPADTDRQDPGSRQRDFVKTVTNELYGGGEGSSVQDQIGRRKYYSERRSDQAAFRR